MAFSQFWSKLPIHAIIKKERAKFNSSLSWLRTTTCFRRHRNVRAIFKGDLNGKITA
jgi:hypothetical protein